MLFISLKNFFDYTKRFFQYSMFRIKKGEYPFPTLFQLQTINSCNASCLMCPHSKENTKNLEIMTDGLFEKIIDEIISESKSPIIFLFLQNESFMDKDILLKVKKVKDKEKKKTFVGIVTNGSLLTAEKIKQLKTSKLDSLTISLDAITKETYNKIRKGLIFQDVLDNIQKVIESDYNKHLAVGFVKQKGNIREIKQFKKYWKKKKLSFNIQNLSNRTGYLKNYEEIDANLFFSKLKYKIFKKLIKYCPLPFESFNILSNGDVILCCNDFKKIEILGNVKNSSIKEIWNSDRYHNIRKYMFNRNFEKIPLCRMCSVFKDKK